jgi:transposase
LLGYRGDPSFFAVARVLGLHHQTVQRWVERAQAYGPLATLDDRPGSGKEPKITVEAKGWLVSLASRKAKDLGYRHELWTTRRNAATQKEGGVILPTKSKFSRKPRSHRRRSPATRLRSSLMTRRQGSKRCHHGTRLAAGAGVHATFARDHEYKRLGTVSPLAGIDLVTGQVADGVDDFIAYLRDERGLSASSLHARRWHVECFLGTSVKGKNSIACLEDLDWTREVIKIELNISSMLARGVPIERSSSRSKLRLGVSRRAPRTTLSAAVSRR